MPMSCLVPNLTFSNLQVIKMTILFLSGKKPKTYIRFFGRNPPKIFFYLKMCLRITPELGKHEKWKRKITIIIKINSFTYFADLKISHALKFLPKCSQEASDIAMITVPVHYHNL